MQWISGIWLSKCHWPPSTTMQYFFYFFFLPDNGITLATFRSYSCVIGLGSCDIHIVFMSWADKGYYTLTWQKVGGRLKYYSDAIAKILKDWHWYIFFQCDDDCQLLLPRNFCVTFGDKTSIGTLQLFLCRFLRSWKTIPLLVLGSRHTGQCVSLLYLFDVTSHHNEISRSSPCTVISQKLAHPFLLRQKLCLFFWKHAHLFKQISLTVFEVCILLRRKYHNFQKYVYRRSGNFRVKNNSRENFSCW